MSVRIEVVRMKSPFRSARVPAGGHKAERTFLNRSDRVRAIFGLIQLWQNPRVNTQRSTYDRQEEQCASKSGDDGEPARPAALFGFADAEHSDFAAESYGESSGS